MPWSTEDELEYLNEIGESGRNPNAGTKKAFLQGYLNSCQRRLIWNSIDKSAVVLHTQRLLRALARHPTVVTNLQYYAGVEK